MILIADSGATKTEWRTITTDGQIGQARTVGISPYYQTDEAIAAELRQNLLPALSGTVTEIHYYGTGCSGPEPIATVERALRAVFPEADKVRVGSDLLGAARALCGKEPGIACILGTGSHACLYDGHDIAQPAVSLGFWLGDEGSGGYLGKTLMVHYLRGELPADLAEKFSRRYNSPDRLMVLDHAYKQPYPNRYFASFSKFLFDNRSHPFAYQLVYEAFGLFVDKYVRTFPGHQNLPVHFVGSVAFYYSDILRRVVSDKWLTPARILENPIAGLALYHQ